MSAEEIKRKKIQYLTCNQGDLHEGEQLNYVSLDCKKIEQVLLCPVCKSQIDKKQKIIPYKIFLAETAQHLQSKSNYTIENLLSQVDSIHSKILGSLRENVQKMAIQIKEVEDQINCCYKNTKQRLLDLNQVCQNFPQLFDQIMNSNYESVNQLKGDVFKIVENISLSAQGKIEIDFKPQKVVDGYNKLSTDYHQQMSNLQSSFKGSIQKILKTLEKAPVVVQVPVLSEFQFSSTLKSSTISLIDNKIANQTTNQNYEKRFALIEPALDLHQKTRFALKITQLSNWVGIGICFLKVLKSKSYKFDYNNLGHGSYLISSNGYSWSHSVKEDNIAFKSFTFLTNDIIICEFDPEKKIVQFKKKGTTTKFQLDVKVPDNDEVYACANLCNQNDKVEIVPSSEIEEGEF